MNRVHPTAVIGPHVSMGTGNTVGPFAVIGGLVTLGDNNWIGSGVKIGCPPEVRSHPHEPDWIESAAGQGVVVGNDNVIREDTQIHAGWQKPTVIGSGTFIMNRVYIAHDCRLEDDVTLASGVTIGGHARIGRGANLGLGATVHQRRIIGALAMVGMSSVVTRDIAPYLKAYGNPSRIEGVNTVGMSRAGLGPDTVDRLVELAGLPGYPASAHGVAEAEADLAWFAGQAL